MKEISESISYKTSPIIQEFFRNLFKSKSGGLKFWSDSFPNLYNRTLYSMKGVFLENEILLMLEAYADVDVLDPNILGSGFLERITLGIELYRLNRRWDIEDKDAFLKKIAALHVFDCACLEIWFLHFWRDIPDYDKDAQDYVEILL